MLIEKKDSPVVGESFFMYVGNCLLLHSSLCGGQRELIIRGLYLFRETFGKHFVFILHVLHPCPNIHNYTDYISYVTLLFILYCYCIHAGA